MSVGRHGPTASSQRPALTAISMGTSANSAIITPTVNVDALLASAYSDPVMRADTNAMCASTAMPMIRTRISHFAIALPDTSENCCGEPEGTACSLITVEAANCTLLSANGRVAGDFAGRIGRDGGLLE